MRGPSPGAAAGRGEEGALRQAAVGKVPARATVLLDNHEQRIQKLETAIR